MDLQDWLRAHGDREASAATERLLVREWADGHGKQVARLEMEPDGQNLTSFEDALERLKYKLESWS